MATIYARLINQYMFINLILFLASFYRINEEGQRSDETEFNISLKINRNLTETDFINIDVESQLEHQIQIQETKESGWIFDKIISMKIKFQKNCQLNGSSFVKILLRSSPLVNKKTDDKYCFIWTVLAQLHRCENDHLNRVSNYRHYFKNLSIECFDCTMSFKCSDVLRFEKPNSLSENIFELKFYQD